jgi:hypothetical protein
MTKFRIYAGLDAAHYRFTDDFDSKEEALQCAYEVAVSDYQYAELKCVDDDVWDFEQCAGFLGDLWGEDTITTDDIINFYTNEVESRIEYYVEEER